MQQFQGAHTTWKVRYGHKRLVIVHEQADLSDTPPLFTHRCPALGRELEASQVRKEEAVKGHFRLRSVAQSLLQRTPAGGRKSERFAFAEDHQQTVGQKLYTLTRDALGQLVQ